MRTYELDIDASNLDQARAWDGKDGDFWVAHADRFDRAVAGYHEGLLDTAAIADLDRVLDIGCGAGRTTRDAARRARGGWALGVDLSASLLDLATSRAEHEHLRTVRFVQGDAQVYAFPARSFDVAISRTGASFFGDPVAAFANIGRALRPGGRLALLTWQPPDANEWCTAFARALGRALPGGEGPGAFSLADPDRTRDVLARAGFADIRLESRREPMWFGQDTDDAYWFVTQLLGVGDDVPAPAREALRSSIEAHDSAIGSGISTEAAGVRYDSAMWIITARRVAS